MPTPVRSRSAFGAGVVLSANWLLTTAGEFGILILSTQQNREGFVQSDTYKNSTPGADGSWGFFVFGLNNNRYFVEFVSHGDLQLRRLASNLRYIF